MTDRKTSHRPNRCSAHNQIARGSGEFPVGNANRNEYYAHVATIIVLSTG